LQFTLIEIMVVVSIVGLLATIAICNIMIARDSSRLHTIQHNLGTVESAKEQWAMDNHKRTGADVADVSVLQDYFHGGTIKQVVQETYIPNPIGDRSVAMLPVGAKVGPYASGSSIPAP
jgi:prepilin-type N-terminal cleavage/methylation domain-containing protein